VDEILVLKGKKGHAASNLSSRNQLWREGGELDEKSISLEKKIDYVSGEKKKPDY